MRATLPNPSAEAPNSPWPRPLGSPPGAEPLAFLGQLRGEAAEVRAALRQAGALLWPATALRTPEALEAALRALGVEPAPYTEGQSPRTRLHGHIYTSTEYPPAEPVPLHHELSYRAAPPALLAFLCAAPPTTGGETPLLDGQAFLAAAPAALLRPFIGQDLLYIKRMHGGFGLGRSWQAHFETEDRAAVAAFVAAEGAEAEWTAEGGLVLRQVRPAIRNHPYTGAPCWHNQATLWHPARLGARGDRLRRALGPEGLPTDVRWASGQPIEDTLMHAILEQEQRQATRRPWAAGDLLLLDNHRVAHGRAPFTGPRRLLVGMGSYAP